MGTPNQRVAAKETARRLEAGERINQGEILEKAGYEATVVKNPRTVFASPGFLDELEKLGFTVEAADTRVSEILKTGEDRDSLKAAELIYKRKGAFVPEAPQQVQNNYFLSPEALKIAKDFEEAMKKNLYAQATEEVQGPLEALGNEAGGSETP